MKKDNLHAIPLMLILAIQVLHCVAVCCRVLQEPHSDVFVQSHAHACALSEVLLCDAVWRRVLHKCDVVH